VSIENEFRSAVLSLVPELVAMVRAELGRPRMLPIKETIVSYRQILDGEKRGELTVYRVGHAALVDETELYAWIRRVGIIGTNNPDAAPAVDDIDRVIAIGDAKRRVA